MTYRQTRLEDLEGYVTGELADGEAADAFEETMFANPDDPNVKLVDALATHGRRLVERGTYDVGVTRAHLESLLAKGLEIDWQRPSHPGETLDVPWNATAELFVTELPLGRTDVERVDVEIQMHDIGHTKIIADVAVDNGTIYGLCERPLAEIAFKSGRSTARVRRRDGAKEILVEYHFAPRV